MYRPGLHCEAKNQNHSGRSVGGNCIHATLTCTQTYTHTHIQGALCMIAPSMLPDRGGVHFKAPAPSRTPSLSYNIKMPFSGVTDEIIGQLCYIIVKSAGNPHPLLPPLSTTTTNNPMLIEEALTLFLCRCPN